MKIFKLLRFLVSKINIPCIIKKIIITPTKKTKQQQQQKNSSKYVRNFFKKFVNMVQ